MSLVEFEQTFINTDDEEDVLIIHADETIEELEESLKSLLGDIDDNPIISDELCYYSRKRAASFDEESSHSNKRPLYDDSVSSFDSDDDDVDVLVEEEIIDRTKCSVETESDDESSEDTCRMLVVDSTHDINKNCTELKASIKLPSVVDDYVVVDETCLPVPKISAYHDSSSPPADTEKLLENTSDWGSVTVVDMLKNVSSSPDVQTSDMGVTNKRILDTDSYSNCPVTPAKLPFDCAFVSTPKPGDRFIALNCSRSSSTLKAPCPSVFTNMNESCEEFKYPVVDNSERNCVNLGDLSFDNWLKKDVNEVVMPLNMSAAYNCDTHTDDDDDDNEAILLGVDSDEEFDEDLEALNEFNNEILEELTRLKSSDPEIFIDHGSGDNKCAQGDDKDLVNKNNTASNVRVMDSGKNSNQSLTLASKDTESFHHGRVNTENMKSVVKDIENADNGVIWEVEVMKRDCDKSNNEINIENEGKNVHFVELDRTSKVGEREKGGEINIPDSNLVEKDDIFYEQLLISRVSDKENVNRDRNEEIFNVVDQEEVCLEIVNADNCEVGDGNRNVQVLVEEVIYVVHSDDSTVSICKGNNTENLIKVECTNNTNDQNIDVLSNNTEHELTNHQIQGIKNKDVNNNSDDQTTSNLKVEIDVLPPKKSYETPIDGGTITVEAQVRDLDGANSVDEAKAQVILYPEEQTDIQHAGWDIVKQLENDKERYRLVRSRWQAKKVPDPNEDLTVHSYRHKQYKGLGGNTPSLDLPQSRKRSAEISNLVSKRQRMRTVPCTFMIDSKINCIRRHFRRCTDMVNNQFRNQVSLLEQEERRLSQFQNQYFNHSDMSSSYHYPFYDSYVNAMDSAVYNMMTMRNEAEHDRLRFEHERVMVENRRMFDKELDKLMSAREEISKFCSFYKGLDDTNNNDPTVLTEAQLKELEQIDEVYEKFENYYQNS